MKSSGDPGTIDDSSSGSTGPPVVKVSSVSVVVVVPVVSVVVPLPVVVLVSFCGELQADIKKRRDMDIRDFFRVLTVTYLLLKKQWDQSKPEIRFVVSPSILPDLLSARHNCSACIPHRLAARYLHQAWFVSGQAQDPPNYHQQCTS